VLAAKPDPDVTIDISSSDPTEGSVSPASITFTSDNWSTPQTVTITGVDDVLFDGVVAYTVITQPAISSDPIYNGLDPKDVSVINQDNDTVLIELDRFSAVAKGNHITVTWYTLSEIDNAGFNIWRSEAEDGTYTRINPGIIEAKGDASSSAEYSCRDNTAIPGVTYYYKLEDIDTRGVSTFHGPVSAMTHIPVKPPVYYMNYPNWYKYYPYP